MQGFRNLQDLSLDLSENTNVFIGDNGQGKTNLLEAIYLFSIGKPFRTKHIYDAISFDQISAHLDLEAECLLSFSMAREPRKSSKYEKDECKISYYDFLANFIAVLFSPDDMLLIKGKPSIRRSYLDSLLIRLDKQYARVLQKFERSLRHRNALLKKIQGSKVAISELDIWDEKFYESSQEVWSKRMELIEKISDDLQKNYQKISDSLHDLKIVYQKKQDSDDFMQDLKNRRNKDIILGTSTIGPQRDSMEFFLAEKSAHMFASQGESRSIVLALKLSEIAILERNYHKKVVLMLDDVFSELDITRQSALLKLIKDRQTCITTTHLDDSLNLGEIKVFEVKSGLVC